MRVRLLRVPSPALLEHGLALAGHAAVHGGVLGEGGGLQVATVGLAVADDVGDRLGAALHTLRKEDLIGLVALALGALRLELDLHVAALVRRETHVDGLAVGEARRRVGVGAADVVPLLGELDRPAGVLLLDEERRTVADDAPDYGLKGGGGSAGRSVVAFSMVCWPHYIGCMQRQIFG